MKKFSVTSLLLVSLFALMILGACGNKTADNNVSSNTSNDDSTTSDKVGAVVSAPGQFPITTEKVTLTAMIPSNDGVEWETNAFTTWFEEKTNVAIKFEEVPAAGKAEALNLRLASGDLPDLIIGFGVSAAQQQIYGEQGVFLPLEGLIKEYGYYIKDLYAYDPTAESIITSPNGSIYSMPSTSDCFHCQYAQKMWIYKPWLDELKLDVPTTTEEFYQVLKAFKENYPGAIPLATQPKGWVSKLDGFLMNAFIYNDNLVNQYMMLNNGKVDVNFNKTEFRSGLEYMHKLYAEGLIAPESFTQDGAGLKAMAEAETHILGACPGGTMCAELYGASGKWYNFVTVPPLEGPAGVRIAANNPFLTSSGAFLINAKTKHPEVAFRLADALYENEVFMRQKYGEPEVYYTATDVGDLKGINGLPAAWKELIPWGQAQNSHWNQTAPILETNDFRLGKAVVIDPEQDLEPILYKESKNNYEPYKVSRDMIVPPLFFNDEQSQELADVKKTIYDYVEEMVARFVIGDLELNENEWTRYLDTLEGMNLKRFLEINQEAYDSKYGK